MTNYEAKIIAPFDNPYAAELFTKIILQAIQKTRWPIEALPQGKIKIGIFKPEDQRANKPTKSPIIIPAHSIN